MNFLAPLFLLGAAAVAAPIVFHLIRRATREQAVFSSLMFLRPSPPKLTRRHRIEHLLLLLLRCAALVLLAFAFARPFFLTDKTDDAAGAAPGRLLLLVDTSASMRRAGLFEGARAAVASRLRQAAAGDQCAIYVFDRQMRPLMSFADWSRTAPNERVALALSRLASVSPSWAGTQLGNALVGAAEAVLENEPAGLRGARRIVLVSDVQTGSRLDGLQAYDWPKGVDLEVAAVRSRRATNAGVSFVAEASDTSASAPRVTRVRVSNSPAAEREQFKVRWAAANNAIGAPAAVDAYVPPGQSRVFTLPQPENRNAFDRVVLDGDDEPFDNTAFAVPTAQRSATVLWLGSDRMDDTKSPLFFLRRAFSDTPRLAVRVTPLLPDAPLAPGAVEQADLVFVADALPAAAADVLGSAVRSGKTAVVVLRSTGAGATLGALLGRAPLAVEEVTPSSYAMFADIDFRHALFAPFADPRFSDFTKIHVWRYRRVMLDGIADARVLARFDSGDPAVIDLPSGKGRVVVFATGWQPEDSQIAVSSKFVPLMWSLLELGGTRTTAPAQVYVGDAVELPAGGATAVRMPGGEVVPIQTGAKSFNGVAEPGVYSFLSNGRETPFAANLDPNESRTEPLAVDELEKLGLPAKEAGATQATSDLRPLRTRAIEQEGRQKLWRWAILATVLVLLTESVVAGWIGRRSRRPGEEAAA